MGKYLSLFFVIIFSLITLSCKNSGKEKTTKDAEPSHKEVFTSPDLSLFQLKGNVKECLIPGDDMNNTVLEFDGDGNLINPKYEKIERNANGEIIEYYDPKTECKTRFKWEDGKVMGVTDMFEDGYNSTSIGYEYDKDNNIVQLIQEGVPFPTNYSNYKFDDFGNWISRTSECNGNSIEENRFITYYNSEVGQDRLLLYYKKNKEKKIQRDIDQTQLEEEK